VIKFKAKFIKPDFDSDRRSNLYIQFLNFGNKIYVIDEIKI